MLRYLVALFILTLNSGAAYAVIGGSAAPELERHSIMVLSKRGSVCSGVVISKKSILTAAHCVADGSEYLIYFRGATGEPVLLQPLDIVIHPEFVRNAISKHARSIDLAIVHLQNFLPQQFDPTELSSEKPRAGAGVIVGGFGLTNERVPTSNGQFLSSPLVVVEPYGESKILLWLKGGNVQKGNPKSGACHGDSGGPVIKDSKLVAITTWTTGPDGYDCGELTQAILIAPQLNWILKNLR